MRVDVEFSNKFRTQWHHDHEIQDMGELNARQRKQKETLSLLGFSSVDDSIQWEALLGIINVTLSSLIRIPAHILIEVSLIT